MGETDAGICDGTAKHDNFRENETDQISPQQHRPQIAWEMHTVPSRGGVEPAHFLKFLSLEHSCRTGLVLEPGLVLLKRALPMDLQVKLAEFAWNRGYHEGGFY